MHPPARRTAVALFAASTLLLAVPVLVPGPTTTSAAMAAGDPATAGAAGNRVIAWNNLGMHCMDDDFSVFSLLPPYNTIMAQVMQGGALISNPTGITVTYKAIADASGSVNKTSTGKSNFWQYVVALYGANVSIDQGLAGKDMPGSQNDEKPMTWDSSLSTFLAEGIPITPYDDASHKNTYPMFRVTAKNASNQTIGTTDIVLPVSDEMTCLKCHGSTSVSNAAKPNAGWVNDPNPILDYRLNVIRLHDEKNAADPTYATALATAGYDSNGLYTQVTQHSPILCAKCHASNALPGTGIQGVKPLTEALHGHHASVVDPSTNMTLNAADNRSACYTCHPGSVTKCLRGAMGSAVAKDGTLAMQCQSCHGSMSKVGTPGRVGWLDEPSCQQCHTGTATNNAGQIRFTSAFDAQGNPHVAPDKTFATNNNVPAQGFDLYRFSKGHGGLDCEACHGSTHAEFPSIHDNDNVQSIQIQGHKGVIAECSACHASVPMSAGLGPHGMHPVGQAWVSAHGEGAGDSGPGDCKACHGVDYKGTVLSRAFGDRTLSTEFGTKKLWKGFQVSCYLCHNGPGSEGGSSNHPAVVKDASLSTDNSTPKSITLSATDSDGNALTLRVVSQPQHGTVGLQGKVATYFPEAGFAGSEKFTYAAWDGKTDSNLGTVTVTVSNNACPASLAASQANFDTAGGAGSIDLTLPSQCAWTATLSDPNATWFTFTSATSGTGNATIGYTVAANGGAARNVKITVAGLTYTVAQAGNNSPDLTGVFKKAQVDCNASGNKCHLDITLRVSNVGGKKSKKTTVQYYLSNDNAFDGADTLLATDSIPQLNPGDSFKSTAKHAVASAGAVSGMFVIAVIDPNDVVVESLETDNVVVTGPLP